MKIDSSSKEGNLLKVSIKVYIIIAILLPFVCHIAYIIISSKFPGIIQFLHKGLKYSELYSALVSFYGGAIGGIATLIALSISVNETRKIQVESEKLEAKKIKTSLQLKASQDLLNLIGESKNKAHNFRYYIVKSLDLKGCCFEINYDEYEKIYEEFKRMISDLEHYYRDNNYILSEIFQEISELDGALQKVEWNKNSILRTKEKFDKNKLNNYAHENIELLDKLMNLLHELKIAIIKKYLSDIFDEDKMNNVDNVLEHTYYES